MRNKLFVIIPIVVALVVAGFLYNKYRVAPKVKFESLALTDLSGNKISLEKFKGKKLFINFFATWCGPCMGEMASIENAQQIFANENFQFLLISDENPERLKNFQQQTQLLVLHSEKKLAELDIATIPTTYILNSKQEVVFKETNSENWASEEKIEQLKSVEE